MTTTKKLFKQSRFLVFAITALVHISLVKVSENDPRRFTSKYLGSIGVKMVIYIVFIAIYLAVNTEKAVPFLVSFLVCYVAFTIVEVAAMLKHQKR